MSDQPDRDELPASAAAVKPVDCQISVDLDGAGAQFCPLSISPVTQSPPLALSTEIYTAGVNGALKRSPHFDASKPGLIGHITLDRPWKSCRVPIRTFGITFPDGLEFLPPKEAADKPDNDLRPIAAPLPQRNEDDGNAKKEKRTRLTPPDDALSLEDRLFYLLQPPLESWLGGLELIMPFEPFGYQYEGIAWLFSQKQALLADEMGLGKTMQAITAMRLLLRGGLIRRVLLICPKPLIPNWQREFRMWAEELPTITVEGDLARRRMIWSMPSATILIANYELLVRDLADIPEEEWPSFDLVVLDEAQRIKNRLSRTAQTARSLPRKRSWALTGTPIENRPEEMASLYEFMEIIPSKANPDLRQLTRLARDFVLRRTKDRVMTDLPPRLDREEYLELAPAQQHAYEIAEQQGVIHLNDLGEKITIQHVFELVLRLKQITNFDPLTGESAKLDRLIANVEEVAASGGKAILFSQWTKCIDWLQQRLAQFGTLVYHGGVPSKRREPILAQFKDDPNSHLLLMSYGTGAVGLNLQFAGYVFLFDRWWNPAVEDQAINRAHRIGQKSPVIVTKFISKDTIEERIDTVLKQKRELFAQILGDGAESNASLSLSAAEIFGLFDLKARAGQGTRDIGPAPAIEEKNDAA
ncbi:MAG: DEAD/DEAH box helicase [Planctomycetaceae bacterium]